MNKFILKTFYFPLKDKDINSYYLNTKLRDWKWLKMLITI